MVVVYVMHALSWQMGKRMHYQPWVSLPNILLRDFAVPELLQGDATPGEDRRRGASTGSTTRRAARVAAGPLRGDPPRAAARHRARSPPLRSRPSSTLSRRMHAKTFFAPPSCAASSTSPGSMAGVDEVGRGPLAGPVVAAAVILDEKRTIRGLNDSKLLTPEERERLDREIRRRRVCFSVAEASVEEIDTLNILRAALLAMRRAVEGAARSSRRSSSSTATSGRSWRCRCAPSSAATPGCASISAASIIAKVHRDRLCLQLHEEHPQYGFDSHKGYSTPEHLAALREHGACPHHRRSFAPVRSVSTGCSERPGDGARSRRSRSRDNPLLARLRKLAGDGAAYRKLGQRPARRRAPVRGLAARGRRAGAAR